MIWTLVAVSLGLAPDPVLTTPTAETDGTKGTVTLSCPTGRTLETLIHERQVFAYCRVESASRDEQRAAIEAMRLHVNSELKSETARRVVGAMLDQRLATLEAR